MQTGELNISIDYRFFGVYKNNKKSDEILVNCLDELIQQTKTYKTKHLPSKQIHH